jgi:hypothetical protein
MDLQLLMHDPQQVSEKVQLLERLCGLQQGMVPFLVTKCSAALKISQENMETTIEALLDYGKEGLMLRLQICHDMPPALLLVVPFQARPSRGAIPSTSLERDAVTNI